MSRALKCEFSLNSLYDKDVLRSVFSTPVCCVNKHIRNFLFGTFRRLDFLGVRPRLSTEQFFLRSFFLRLVLISVSRAQPSRIPDRFPEAFLGDFLAPLLSAEPGLQSEKSLTSMGRPFGSGMRGTPLPWVRGISGDNSPNLFSDYSLLFCATIFTPARLSCFIRESVRDFSLKFLR